MLFAPVDVTPLWLLIVLLSPKKNPWLAPVTVAVESTVIWLSCSAPVPYPAVPLAVIVPPVQVTVWPLTGAPVVVAGVQLACARAESAIVTGATVSSSAAAARRKTNFDPTQFIPNSQAAQTAIFSARCRRDYVRFRAGGVMNHAALRQCWFGAVK
jgi:hypothetical protein